MSKVRVLVGTRKGAFVLTSDGKREQVGRQRSPFCGLGDLPRQRIARRSEPAVCVAVQRLVRTGDPALERRRQDLGAGGQQVCVRRRPRHAPVVRRHAASLGVQARLASRTVADRSGHGLRRRGRRRLVPLDRRRAELAGTSGLRGHGSGPHWQPGAGGMCLHTILLDPSDPKRIYIAISAAGAFRTDDGGETWQPINRGLQSQYIPDPNAEVGHCVHRIAMHRSRPDVLFMQKHWDVMRSDNAGDSWHEVSGNLPTDFGFVDRRPRARAGDHLRRPDQERFRALSARRQSCACIAAAPAATSGRRSPTVCRKATATSTCCATPWPSIRSIVRRLFRHHRRAGVRVADAGDNWAPIVRDLPAVLSVEVQTLS